MGKIETLNNYIDKCESKNLEGLEKQQVLRTIVLIYSGEILNLTDGLSLRRSIEDNLDYSYDLDYDLEILKLKLEKHRDNLMHEDQKRIEELKISESKSQHTIYNLLQNTNNSISSATAIVTVTINQTMKNINDLPKSTLSEDDSEKLINLIYSIEGAISAKDKDGIKSKVEKSLKFIADKGIDVLIAAGPYLLQAAGVIQTIS